jgi:hypothetical protein
MRGRRDNKNMKYFFDTEFIESKGDKAIDLISIGIVAEDGRELYYISNQFNPCNANQWVKDNVFIHLPPAPIGSNIFARVDFPRALNPSANFWTPERVNLSDPFISPSVKQSALLWQDREP